MDEENKILIKKDGAQPIKISKWRTRIAVEPLCIFFIMATMGNLPLTQEYLYYRLGNETLMREQSAKGGCQNESAIDPDVKRIIQDSQDKSASWIMYISGTSFFCSFIIIPILGAYSDAVGRRFVIILPCVGALIRSAIFCAVVFLDIPLEFLLIGSVIDGFSGMHHSFLLGCFSFIADITNEQNRIYRMVILEMCNALAAALSQLAIGTWINDHGFRMPSIFVSVLYLICIIHAIIVVPETLPKREHEKKGCARLLGYLKDAVNVYKRKRLGIERATIITILIVCIFTAFGTVGPILINNLFLLNKPFCWDPRMIGYYNFGTSIAVQIGSLVGTLIFVKCLGFSFFTVIVISFISASAAYTLTGFAFQPFLLFIVIFVGMFKMLENPMKRTILSQTVGKNEQGAAFAGLSFVEIPTYVISTSVFTAVYKKTQAIWPGFAYFMGGASYFIALVIIIFLIIAIMKENRRIVRMNSINRTNDDNQS